jgi:hypothetical protein
MAAHRRTIVRAGVVATFLLPSVLGLAIDVNQGRTAFAVAATLPLIATLALAGRSAIPTRTELADRPLLPFALLYLACAVYGGAFAVLQGNATPRAAGQCLTALLFVAGFFLIGPMIQANDEDAHWRWFLVALAALCIPSLIPLLSWVAHGAPNLERFLAPAAFFAPFAAVIGLRLRGRGRGSIATRAVCFAFFAAITVLTFTRSYWLGLAVSLLALALVALPALRPTRRNVAWVVAAVPLVVAVAMSPVGARVRERILMTHTNSIDISVDVRSSEARAALRTVRDFPLTGLGAGGEFVAAHQVSSTAIELGPTNFVHDAYIYFPLKFGFLGFAALIALLAGLVRMVLMLREHPRTRGATSSAVVLGIVATSLTAPNLVDPRYSVAVGALFCLADARPRLRSVRAAGRSENTATKDEVGRHLREETA